MKSLGMNAVLVSGLLVLFTLFKLAGCGLVESASSIPQICGDFCGAMFRCNPAGSSSGVTVDDCTRGCEVQAAANETFLHYVQCTQGKACLDWAQCTSDGGAAPDSYSPARDR